MFFGSFRTSTLTHLFAPMQSEMAGMRLAVRALQAQVAIMSIAFDNLTAAVAAQVSVDQSAVTLIQGIVTELKSVSSDTQVQALADQITAATAPLAAAVSTNTPEAAVASTPAASTASAATSATSTPSAAPTTAAATTTPPAPSAPTS